MDDTTPKTHYKGCWWREGHHACAIAMVEQLQAEVERLQMLLSQDGTAYLPCQRCHKNVAVPTLESVELCFDCWEQMNTKIGQLQAQAANVREAVAWLWGFYDGNSLRAIPGFEDDIRDAWDKLWVALDSANGVTQPQGQTERLATLEQQLARRDVEYEAASRAALALEERLVEAERRAEALHRVMMDANRIVDVALDDCQVKSTYCDGCPASARDRILWLNERAGRAENLAALVTPELAGILESLARMMDETGMASDVPSVTDEIERAYTLAARIREVLSEH